MEIPADTMQRLRASIHESRLVETALRLMEVPSPTRSGREAADRLAELLRSDGFPVERPEAGWPEAPAVVTRLDAVRPGRTLQFNGHLDTVHLPFVPPRLADGILTGSGASDMKGGLAAAVEALRALRDADALPAGGVLLTAHELHEAPWGDGSQVDGLIDAGYVGDGVLLPEYHAATLPIIGRGLAILHVRVTRPGEPVHEVLGGSEQPSVIAAGAEVVRRFVQLDRELAAQQHPLAGRESLFVGQVAAGEIYNQSPVEFRLQGTRRWLPASSAADVEADIQSVLGEVRADYGVGIEGQFQLVRDAYQIAEDDPLAVAFQTAHAAATGRTLPLGAKPFVDDGNAFVRRGGIPAITHGPAAAGAHTTHERVAVAELVRVATVYALTAIVFCVRDV